MAFAASAGGDAAEFPTGTFAGSRQPDWSISFEDNGRFTVISAGTCVATGAWAATETHVSLTDDPGPTADAGKAKTGRYGWQHEWGTLSFTLLRDDSEGRGLLLTKNDWIDSRLPRLGAWVGAYYQNPVPNEVVEKVREMSTLGVLRATGKRGRPDANIMFLGKVMQANPSRIAEWMDQLATLPAREQEMLRKAVWYSDSEAGRAWLVAHGAGEMAKGVDWACRRDGRGREERDGPPAGRMTIGRSPAPAPRDRWPVVRKWAPARTALHGPVAES